MCGEEYLCNKWPGMVGYTVNHWHTKCPPCSCDEECTKNKTCCPDAFFMMKRKRHEVFITPFLYRSMTDEDLYDTQYSIITECPSETLKTSKELCETFSYENLKRLFPVTSIRSNYTYINQMCALCHGEDESDLVRWYLSSRPTNGLHISLINMISSFQSLFNFSKITHHVSVPFVPPESILPHIYSEYSRKYKEVSCPSYLDPDIQRACSAAYVRPYGGYRNIFCYVCDFYEYFKYHSFKEKIIDTCNANFNDLRSFLSIQNACMKNPSTIVTYPFKNIYCYICSTNRDFTRNFNDMDSSSTCHSTESFTFSVHELSRKTFIWEHHYLFYNITFNLDIIMEQINNVSLIDVEQKHRSKSPYNITDIVFKLAAVFPDRIYNRDILPIYIQNHPPMECNNELSCIFEGQCDCCLDTAFTHPVSCLENFAEGIKTESVPMVVSDCLNFTSFHSEDLLSNIRHLCITNTGPFQSIPVQSKNVTFKNVFCFLCNSKFTERNGQIFMEDYHIVPFITVCSSILPYHYTTNFFQILEIAMTLHCNIALDLRQIPVCYKIHDEKTRCLSSLPRKNDNHWACRDTSMSSFTWIQSLKWDFCFDCALERPVPVQINQCHDSRDLEACNLLPVVTNHPLVSPYKNIYCASCALNCSNCFGRITQPQPEMCKIPKGEGYSKIEENYRDLFLPTVFQLNQRIKGPLTEVSSVLFSYILKKITI